MSCRCKDSGTTCPPGQGKTYIPPEDRDRVFERFTHLDDGRSRIRGGSGLGLAVVRSLATRHGGRIWAEDSPLGGTCVVIALSTPTPTPMRPSSSP